MAALAIVGAIAGWGWTTSRLGSKPPLKPEPSSLSGPILSRSEGSPEWRAESVTPPREFESPRVLANQLFVRIDPPTDAALLEARLTTPSNRIEYVRLTPGLLNAKSSPLWTPNGRGAITLPLGDSGIAEVSDLRTEILGSQRHVTHGILTGRPGSRVLIAYNRGAVAAQILDPELGEFHLRSVTAESGPIGQFFQVDPARLKVCGGSPSPSSAVDVVNAWSTRRAAQLVQEKSAARAMVSARADLPEAITVRLLFAYTSAVRFAYGTVSQVESVIDLSVAGVNADFANTQVPVRIQLAAALQVNLTEGAPNYERLLASLRGRTDGVLDEIHAARDEAAADLVTLGLSGNDTGNSLGIAYLLEEPNDYVNQFFAFSVVQFGVMSSNSVLSHELGHNFGCAHDRENSQGKGAYPFSYGYRFFARDSRGQNQQFRDIMAYSPGTRLPYFSNPRIKLDQAEVGGASIFFSAPAALGIEAGQPGEADGARTIELNAFEVANYRVSPERPFDRGTLINVSTRAFVGTGSRQLIGGFIVTGPATKKILVRAAGPALAAFGVPGVLENPILRIFRLPQGELIAENDDWGLQTNPQETTVLGFPFASGSRDSALLLSLPPGSYSANIEGSKGTTGTALVEAYEVERPEGMRLINLSTRAFADKTSEIVAGFVIGADASSPNRTKRVLIRVLGPTLEAFGVADVMTDPMMVLYDARGQRLLENDDWDPPTTSLGSGVGVTRGVVDQHSEQVIFDVIKALNLPPMRPVEPAVLVDLLPGSYTVAVRPFESLESNQPAVPGVGIVEVYEVLAR